MKILPYGIFIVLYYIFRAVFIIPQENKFYIAFLNVGQGDAFVINIPTYGKVLLDTGFNYQANYLSARHSVFPVCQLKSVFITHFDFDHIGGLDRVARYCKSIRRYDNLSTGDVLTLGDARFSVLSPPTKNTTHEENDDSIVVFLQHRNFKALLPGDAGIDVLEKLLLLKSEDLLGLLDLDVYKVAHHGSKYNNSFSFIDQLKPKYCVISVGKNTFGHPAQQVLDDLNRAGCVVLRTDQVGTIMLY